ncbi:DEAD/DEAH box helicase family protein [Salinibacter ruber]|uniref:DEAD/DEAH box helicase family protein n=1 Tax=Salinibacter ruber TaxID=146919 RepID=UPI0021685873|nr:DEAD/DEAH box helicase family protein [Salinibacter ruber]MCS4149270.1 superfamily II DNA or RNA helicase [Salinibacter ruber]
MSLRDVFSARTIDTSSHDIVDDFFVPMLQNATRYDRGVGYFSSGWLQANARGMVDFAENGGRARWITSPNLTESDWEHLRRGEEARRNDALQEALRQDIDDLENALKEDTLSALAWMVADGILEFRLALPHSDLEYGEFHDKFGIFEDEEGNQVSFNGSYNDSKQGLRNYESIRLFCSWDETGEFVEADQRRFRKLWHNNDPNVEIHPLPEAARQKILNLRSGDGRPYSTNTRESKEDGKYSVADHKWRHQNKAVDRFLKKERGVLEMATGTGKTRTSLRICKNLIESGQVDTVIVSTYGNDLLDQWYPKLLDLTGTLSQSFSVYRHYGEHRESVKFRLDPVDKFLLASRKNLPPVLRSLSSGQARSTLLVHDEIHGLGSPANRENLDGLTDKVRYRLGLSATPERAYDDEGNEFIEDHVGPVIYKFDLEDAISRGILCPFEYVPLSYELTERDRRRRKQVFQEEAARKGTEDPMEKKEKWIKLAKVRKSSESKIPVFEKYAEENPDLLKRCIIFVETKEYGEKITSIVHNEHTKFHTYYGDDEEKHLSRFKNEEIECLVTCEKLSEGIDIPSLKNIVLFSSPRAKLKTIQRIGRCLRTDSSNPDKEARVVDFVDENRSDGSNGEEDFKSADQVRLEFLEELSKVEPDVSENPNQ